MEETNQVSQFYHKWSMKYRRMIDRYTNYPGRRWLVLFIFFIIYVHRIVVTQSYFVVSYILGLFIMQSLLKFFTPLGLPDVEDEDDVEFEVSLPHSLEISNDRPLLRQMSEISLWETLITALSFAICATFFEVLDLPVYWPFLLCYFIMLVLMTFKKYGYSFSDFGKNKNRTNQR